MLFQRRGFAALQRLARPPASRRGGMAWRMWIAPSNGNPRPPLRWRLAFALPCTCCGLALRRASGRGLRFGLIGVRDFVSFDAIAIESLLCAAFAARRCSCPAPSACRRRAMRVMMPLFGIAAPIGNRGVAPEARPRDRSWHIPCCSAGNSPRAATRWTDRPRPRNLRGERL